MNHLLSILQAQEELLAEFQLITADHTTSLATHTTQLDALLLTVAGIAQDIESIFHPPRADELSAPAEIDRPEPEEPDTSRPPTYESLFDPSFLDDLPPRGAVVPPFGFNPADDSYAPDTDNTDLPAFSQQSSDIGVDGYFYDYDFTSPKSALRDYLHEILPASNFIGQGGKSNLLKAIQANLPLLGLINGLFGLFDQEPEPIELIKTIFPAARQFEALLNGNGNIALADHDQFGTARAAQPTFAEQIAAHRDHIAAAVREAMLHNHSIHDVIYDS